MAKSKTKSTGANIGIIATMTVADKPATEKSTGVKAPPKPSPYTEVDYTKKEGINQVHSAGTLKAEPKK